MTLTPILIALGLLVIALGATLAVLKLWYRQPHEGQALLISGIGGNRVCLDGGGLVLPVLHRGEAVDLTTAVVVIERRGRQGLYCKDGVYADARLVFFVRVSLRREDVLRVAQQIGCRRAADPETLKDLFEARFSEATKQAAAQRSFAELFAERLPFKDDVLAGIGPDLGGYTLDNMVLDHLARAPASEQDPTG